MTGGGDEDLFSRLESDPFFKRIDERYPGSKTKRKMVARDGGFPAQPRQEDAWDSKSQVKTVHGQQVEMFHIGALAKAVNKSQGTIRGWFEDGLLPETPYRLPSREVNGALRKGKRLFTREMIEVVIKAFDDRQLLGSARVEWSQNADLSSEVKAAWARIQASLKNNS